MIKNNIDLTIRTTTVQLTVQIILFYSVLLTSVKIKQQRTDSNAQILNVLVLLNVYSKTFAHTRGQKKVHFYSTIEFLIFRLTDLQRSQPGQFR